MGFLLLNSFYIFMSRTPNEMKDHKFSGMFSAKFNDNKMGTNLLMMIVQVVVCILAHDLAVSLYPKERIAHRDIGWGIGLSSLFIYFGLLVFLQNVADVFVVRKHFIIGTITSVIFIVIVSPYYGEHPLRSLNVMINGVAAIWLKYFIEYLFRLRTNKQRIHK
jgi:hypothetical protein